jgi:hypothetical protein
MHSGAVRHALPQAVFNIVQQVTNLLLATGGLTAALMVFFTSLAATALAACSSNAAEMSTPIMGSPAALLGAPTDDTATQFPAPELRLLDVHRWRVIPRESGPVDYYSVIEDHAGPYIHAAYRPGLDTTVLGFQLMDSDRAQTHKLRWAWRADAFPAGGNECAAGKGDSAAVVYVTWKRGLKWYTLKYAWSTDAPRGSVCAQQRNAFVAQDTIILESGGPTGVWRGEEIDLASEFRRHFGAGDAQAEVPELQGFAIMSDGDQTHSVSSADYARFVIVR